MKSINERIDAGLKARGISATDLSDSLGISKQYLSSIKAERAVGRKHLQGIAEALGCSVEWLTSGTGEAPAWAKPTRLADAIAFIQAEAEARAAAEGVTRQEALSRIVLENLGVPVSAPSDDRLSRMETMLGEVLGRLSAIEDATAGPPDPNRLVLGARTPAPEPTRAR